MKTEQQLKNLREALVWWQTVPEENVANRLSRWRQGRGARKTASCKTVACFGGWCAVHPSLVAQGVKTDWQGAPTTDDYDSPTTVSEGLFGDRELFYTRGRHRADAGFKGSDHALVTNRIRWALEH